LQTDSLGRIRVALKRCSKTMRRMWRRISYWAMSMRSIGNTKPLFTRTHPPEPSISDHPTPLGATPQPRQSISWAALQAASRPQEDGHGERLVQTLQDCPVRDWFKRMVLFQASGTRVCAAEGCYQMTGSNDRTARTGRPRETGAKACERAERYQGKGCNSRAAAGRAGGALTQDDHATHRPCEGRPQAEERITSPGVMAAMMRSAPHRHQWHRAISSANLCLNRLFSWLWGKGPKASAKMQLV
jgi:hypothetical protein